MKPARAATFVAMVVLLAPTALAVSPFTADKLRLTGDTTVESDIAALFFLAMDDGVGWDATATSGTLTRTFADYRSTINPTNPDNYLTTFADPWKTESIDLTEVSMASTSTLIGGAMLVTAEAGTVDAESSGLVEVKAVTDPLVEQDEDTPTATSDDESGFIVETIPGDYLDLTFSEGTFVLRGELTITLYGPGYILTADGSSTDWQTGQFETTTTAVYAEGREERHEIILHDAILRVRASEPTTIFTTFPMIDIVGTLEAPRAAGSLQIGGATVKPTKDGGDLVYTGAATLTLANDAGRVGAATPMLAVGASGAVVSQGPPLLPVAIGLVALCALAAILLIVRARRDRGDDMELALLAMEERRWNDALPHLTRITKKRPDDASAQIDRALCLEQVGRFEEASRAFEAALRAAPKHAEAHFYYARTLAKMREPEAARVHLETALERDPRLVEMARGERVLRGL